MLCCYKLWQMPNFCPKNLLELLDQKWFFATLCCCCSECQKQKLEKTHTGSDYQNSNIFKVHSSDPSAPKGLKTAVQHH